MTETVSNEMLPSCLAGDFDCPYYTEWGKCTLGDPAQECDEYIFYASDDYE